VYAGESSILVWLMGNAAAGYALVATASYVAPSRKKLVACVVAGVVAVAVAFGVVTGAEMRDSIDVLGLILSGIGALGAVYVAVRGQKPTGIRAS